MMSDAMSGFRSGHVHASREDAFSDLFLEPLATEWDELAQRANASPFLRPGWVGAWWRAFGTGNMEIRTVTRDGRLAAILPVVRRHGALRSVTNDHTPRFGLLAEDASAATELARTLFAQNPRRVSIAALDPIGLSIKACQQAADEAGYRVIVRPFQRSPYLEVKGEWQEYESQLSRNLLDDLRKSDRRLSKQGKLSVEITDGRERPQELLDEGFAIEACGWKGTSGTAIQSRTDTLRFYTDVARWAASRGTFRLFFLRLDQRPLAMLYALEENGICHLLKSGFDPAFSRFSPGKLLMRGVVSHCFSAGVSRIEFHGDAEPYKLCWADSVEEQERFDAFSSSPAGRLEWATLAHGRPMTKRVLSSLGMWDMAVKCWSLTRR
jgi:CelD/BcsL family acetyltransferase involved in cellulose biosynthesis